MVPRPALVISQATLGPNDLLIWVLMITNALHDPWPDEVFIPDAENIGLIIPSKIRTAEITAVETQSASLIGHLDGQTLREVRSIIQATLGF